MKIQKLDAQFVGLAGLMPLKSSKNEKLRYADVRERLRKNVEKTPTELFDAHPYIEFQKQKYFAEVSKLSKTLTFLCFYQGSSIIDILNQKCIFFGPVDNCSYFKVNFYRSETTAKEFSSQFLMEI